jgi:glycosyltransferase involved in cell wall biosynthesis
MRKDTNEHLGVLKGALISIGFVTTWNVKCGIAEYARYLATALPSEYRISVFANREPETVRPDEDFVARCWELGGEPKLSSTAVEELVRLILESGIQAVSIQYNFSFFSPHDLSILIDRLKKNGIVTAVTMHAINHPNFAQLKQPLESADICLCHRQADVDALRELGVTTARLQKQGIVTSLLDQNRSAVQRSRWRHCFVVSCFGFFLPPKGVYQLIQAFARARTVEPLLRLKLVNSLYPIPDSVAYARECIRLIKQMCLGGAIEITTAFLAPEDALRQLADTDLVVLPYLYSTESSSAAGAFAIASLTPVLCSDLPLFDELSGVIHRFPSGDVMALANKILQLAADPNELGRYRTAQEKLVRELAWPTIARDFGALLAERVDRVEGDGVTQLDS